MPEPMDGKVVRCSGGIMYVKENKVILDISLDMCMLILDTTTVDFYSVFIKFVVFCTTRHIFEPLHVYEPGFIWGMCVILYQLREVNKTTNL